MPKFRIILEYGEIINSTTIEMVFRPALVVVVRVPKGRGIVSKGIIADSGDLFCLLKLNKSTTTLMYKIIILFILLVLVISYLTSNQENTKAKQTCYCETDQYNCEDFESREEAQIIYDCCLRKTGYDVHCLDGDNDERVCEW